MTQYRSTRGWCDNVTFEHVLFSGYTPDGGLYVPRELPTLSRDTLNQWRGMSYRQLVKVILPLFVPEEEIQRDDLNDMIDRAHARIDHPDLLQIRTPTPGLHILEMFYGPTLAFKDYSLLIIGEMMEYFTRKRRQHATIAIVTSGDTGSAAIEAVRGRENLDIVVFLPRGYCTPTQERQMTTCLDDNVHVFAGAFTNTVADTLDDIVRVVVPSGAAGNLSGGVVAYLMGLPIRLVAVNNANHVLARLIEDGEYSAGPCVHTLAVSMDIQMANNVERLVYLLSGYDTTISRNIMDQYERGGYKATIPPDVLEKIRNVISCHTCTDDVIKSTMLRCYHDYGYLICPHTATGVSYHFANSSAGESPPHPRVYIATASPEKFPEVVRHVGLTPRGHVTIDALPSLPTRMTSLSRNVDLETVLRETAKKISKKHGLLHSLL